MGIKLFVLETSLQIAYDVKINKKTGKIKTKYGDTNEATFFIFFFIDNQISKANLISLKLLYQQGFFNYQR